MISQASSVRPVKQVADSAPPVDDIPPPWKTDKPAAQVNDFAQKPAAPARPTESAAPVAKAPEVSAPPLQTNNPVPKANTPEPNRAAPASQATDYEKIEADDEWYKVVKSLKLSGLAAALIQHCNMDEQTDSKIMLHLESASEMLMREGVVDEIEAALNEYYGTQRTLVVALRDLKLETPAQYDARYLVERQQAAEQHIHEDSFVKALAERFGARVVPGSVRPKTE
jgi:DNA polymerase-3 subunit gamma/tau